MSFVLRVVGRTQTSPMSCWWASTAMVLQYYGRNFNLPSEFKREFCRPALPLYGNIPDLVYPNIEEVSQHTIPWAQNQLITQPYEWYQRGLPIHGRAFELFSEITGFRGINRPAFGEWTVADVERLLRDCGPLIFFGLWNSAPHSIVLTGVKESEAGDCVVIIDPNMGFAMDWPMVEFNNRMGEIMPTLSTLNPFYYPDSR
jgi:hypothetical protein